MADKQPNYLDVVANAFSAAKAWRTATFVLAAVVAFLAYSLVSQQRNTPVVLVPFELATSGRNMQVTTSGELRGTSSEYMANMGLSDLGLILNFTPDNVISQHMRFLNRLTEQLYGQQRENLLAQADDYRRRSMTQSFYPRDVKVSTDSTKVSITGTQIRWIGGKESARSTVTYELTYRIFRGYAHISDLRQATDTRN